MTEEIKKEAETQEGVVEVAEDATETTEAIETAETTEVIDAESTAEIAEQEAEYVGIIESNLKTDLPDIRSGDTVKVHQILKEKNNKERVKIFEGQVLACKHGRGITGTITVRKVIGGIGVEKIFPIHSPSLSKIEVVKRTKTRRSKLYYLRDAKGRKARLKTVAMDKKESAVEE
jgi:large subunit ribosomal protein L19